MLSEHDQCYVIGRLKFYVVLLSCRHYTLILGYEMVILKIERQGSLLYGTVRNTCFSMLAVLWYWYSFFFTWNVLMLIMAIYLWNMISSDCQQSKCLCVGHSRSLASSYFWLWDQLQVSFDWYGCDYIKSLFFLEYIVLISSNSGFLFCQLI